MAGRDTLAAIQKFFKQRIEYISLSILLLSNCAIMYVMYIINLNSFSTLHDSPIYVAFKAPLSIYFGITVNVATCIPTIMDLIMDIKNYRDLTFEGESGNTDINKDSWIERLFLAILSIVPGSVVLLLRHNANVPYIYAAVHALQGLGSMCTVLLICKKQVPKYFSTSNIMCAMIFLSSASITSMIGFGRDILYLPNILTYLFLLIGLYYFNVKIGFPWMRDMWIHSITNKKPLSIEDTCAMWYFMNTVFIIVVVHGAVSINKLFEWTRFDSWDIDVFVYSFALYSVINSTVPGRLARIAVDKERKKMVLTKRALIRYLSHEVRSPLNVIHSGLNLLVTDLETLPPIKEMENLLETFTSIHHASSDLLETMNDLLLLESMDSAAFSIQEKMVPCAKLTQVAEQCGVLPRAKGITFTVNNQFDVEDEPHPQPVMAVDLADQSTPLRDIELGVEPKVPESEQLLFIDEHKIGQVLRNLITNSAKFTPPGESIAVNIRRATTANLTEIVDQTGDESEASIIRRARTKKFTDENGYFPCGGVLIEVKDTGVGIAPEHWAKVFGQFVQFDAHKLQVMTLSLFVFSM